MNGLIFQNFLNIYQNWLKFKEIFEKNCYFSQNLVPNRVDWYMNWPGGGIRLVHGLTKKHPNHVFFRYENRPLIGVFACIFLNLPVMSFPKFVYMTKKHTLFSNFAHFCTPKHCLVLKNNPNYVNFRTSLIPPLTFECPPPPPWIGHFFLETWYMYGSTFKLSPNTDT